MAIEVTLQPFVLVIDIIAAADHHGFGLPGLGDHLGAILYVEFGQRGGIVLGVDAMVGQGRVEKVNVAPWPLVIVLSRCRWVSVLRYIRILPVSHHLPLR